MMADHTTDVADVFSFENSLRPPTPLEFEPITTGADSAEFITLLRGAGLDPLDDGDRLLVKCACDGFAEVRWPPQASLQCWVCGLDCALSDFLATRPGAAVLAAAAEAAQRVPYHGWPISAEGERLEDRRFAVYQAALSRFGFGWLL